MKITPREGDYLETSFISYEEYIQVVTIFLAHGARPNNHPILHFNSVQHFGWATNNYLVASNAANVFGENRRLLSLSDLLGDDDIPWNGEGLPPVGAECEIREKPKHSSPFKAWSKCKLLAINIGRDGDTQFIVKDNNGDAAILYSTDTVEFRPLKSEREIAIEHMGALRLKWQKNSTLPENLFGLIYDAGYRKVVE